MVSSTYCPFRPSFIRSDIGLPTPSNTSCRLKVKDKKVGRDDLAAFACIRLDRLQPGYRFIHLLDAKGLRTEGMLLVKIDKRLS